jgi:ATP-binding cassette subfamily B (MDR/TAP) protein 1
MGGRRDIRAESSGGQERDGAAGGNGSLKPPPPAMGRVSLHRLFAFADRMDALLMAVGALAAVANGMAQPLMTFVVGDVIGAFGSAESSDDVLHSVIKVPERSTLLICSQPPNPTPFFSCLCYAHDTWFVEEHL